MSEERYRTLFESIDQGFCVVEVICDDGGQPVDYRFMESNPAFEAHTGLRAATGRTVRDLVPNIEPFWVETYGRVALTGEPARFEHRAEGLDGGWFEVYAFRFGRVEQRQVAIFFKNATERKRAEEALRASERRLQEQVGEFETLLTVLPVGIGIALDRECHTVRANPALARVLRLEDGQNASKTASARERPIHFRCFDADGREIPDDQLPMQVAAREGREVNGVEFNVVHDDGLVVRLLEYAAPLFDENGEPRGCVGAFVDVTGQAESAEQIRDSEARLRLAVEAAGIGYWTWDLASNRSSLDEKCAVLFGLDPAMAASAEDVLVNVHVDDRPALDAAVQAALDGSAPYDVEFRVPVADGSVRWLAGKGNVVRNDAGQPVRMTGVNIDTTARRQVEGDLRQHRDLVETVVRHLPVGAALIRGADLRYQVVNEAYQAIFEHRSFLGRTVYEAWPETQPVFGERCRRVLDTGEPYEALDEEFHIRRSTGDPLEPRYFSWSMHRVPLPGEGGWGILISVWETTERKRIEQALSHSEHRFRFFANSIPQLAWMARPDGWIDWYNDRWFEYTGTTIEDMQGWGWAKVHDPLELQRMLVTWKAAIASGEPFEDTFPLRRHDGAMRWHLTRARPLRDADGTVVLWFGTNTDVEDHRRTAEALRDSQERFRSAVSAATDILWTNNAEGQMVGEQAGWGGFTGQTPDEYRGYGWSKAVHTDDAQPTIDGWEEAVREKKTFVFEHRVRRRDGAYRVCALRAVPVMDDDGSIREWVGVHTDLTEQRQHEERREQLLEGERAARVEAERVGRMQDEFLATLSHELRTPLNAILGWSQIIERGQADQNAIRQGVTVIERNARAQAELIEDLLDMSRIVSGKIRLDVRRISLADAIDAALETVRPAAELKKIGLTKVLDPVAASVSGDPERLQQVIWNLLSNAVKFTPVGGKVEVRLEQTNGHLKVSVADTGQGITPEFMPHVFERFQQADGGTTRKHGGLGLGLAIVKQLVELHGGSVSAQSPGEGEGATFTVHLPLTTPTSLAGAEGVRQDANARARNPDASPSELATLAGLRVLVVDDEPDARELARQILCACHADVAVAGSGMEALRRLEEGERIDVLVSDVGMPGMDGFDLIRRVRALGAGAGGRVPAVALTAYARAEDRRLAVSAGYQAHLAKPVDAGKLVSMVAALAGRTGTQARGSDRPDTAEEPAR